MCWNRPRLLALQPTDEERVEDGQGDEQLVERLLEGRPAEDGDGGAVAHQPEDADKDGEDALADRRPDLRLRRHDHTAAHGDVAAVAAVAAIAAIA